MIDSHGNLALKRKKAPARPDKGKIVPIRARRVDVKTQAHGDAEAKKKQVRQRLARQRLKTLVLLVGVVMLVSGIFALVVYRQAMILEQNFENLALERQIVRMEQENSQIQELLAQNTNLDQIRQQAIEDLGLQDPARTQIVSVRVPETDRVLHAAPTVSGPDDDAYLARVFGTVEGYFLTMNQQRQGE